MSEFAVQHDTTRRQKIETNESALTHCLFENRFKGSIFKGSTFQILSSAHGLSQRPVHPSFGRVF
jgi:hypothetical protein